MTERGAVLRTVGEPLRIEDITLAPLAPDQVRVRIAASGVCHSDLSQATGALPVGTPCVLGHEGAGVIEAVGAQVHHVKPGDHVVIAWVAACGQCWFCRRGEVHLCRNAIRDSYSMPYATDTAGTALFTSMGVSSFATATNCLARRRRRDRRRHSAGDRVIDRLRRRHRGRRGPRTPHRSSTAARWRSSGSAVSAWPR